MIATDRLLILAPRGRDASVIAAQLAAAGTTATVATAKDIVEAIRANELGAAIVADEAMGSFELKELGAALAAQPPWSDSPFLVLTRREPGGSARARLMDLLGNVTMLERPLHIDVLISGVRSALRARRRQRGAEAYLLDREKAEAKVRELAATLESRVAERTAALSLALAERTQAQDQLSESEELYRYTVELTAQTPWTADANGHLQGVGGAPVPKDWRSRVHGEDVDAVEAAWAVAVATAAPFAADLRLSSAAGRFAWWRIRAAPRLAADGSVMRWYGTLEDIDERQGAANKLRQIQAELIHVSRLSAMGAMASTLAHELNQPLTAITNYVRGSRRMLADYPDNDVIIGALDQADRNAVRAGDIVRRVRELVTKGDVQRQPEDLSTLVREACTLAMVGPHVAEIDLRIELTRTPIAVMVDRVQIQQVLLNLLRNAAEAMSEAPLKRIVVATSVQDINTCEVTVRDTGPGIAEAAAVRLFEPFNTSKSEGMGIGLSICRTIIEAHGGFIWNRAARNGGTVFGFTLVRVSDEAEAVR